MTTQKMRLTVAHNNDFDLIPELARFDAVESVYGKMAGDIVGGGRNSYLLEEVNFADVKRFVQQAHAQHMKYNYLLNSPCLSNLEMTRKYNDQLFQFIGELVEIGVDGFVVAMPYLLDLIKHHFPKVTVSVSTFALINSITKAKMWEDQGADRIIIYQDHNRDFKLLSKIRKAVSCEIELFANNLCLNQCPYPQFHAVFNAHGSTISNTTRGFPLDYCGYQCTERRLQNPTEFVRGRFIRPEDIHLYQDLGVDVFKIADRAKATHWITRAVDAYTSRSFDGNLANLIGYPFLRMSADELKISSPRKWAMRPDLVHMDIINEIRQIGEAKELVFIDNKKLDGFIDYFQKHDCRQTICDEECTHCRKAAERAVTADTAAVKERISHHRKLVEMLVDRSAFAPEPLMKQFIIKAIARTRG